MKKTIAAGLGLATFIALGATAFAQDTIMDATPSAIPERGAGAGGLGVSAAGPRFNESIVDNLPGRAAPLAGRSAYAPPLAAPSADIE